MIIIHKTTGISVHPGGGKEPEIPRGRAVGGSM